MFRPLKLLISILLVCLSVFFSSGEEERERRTLLSEILAYPLTISSKKARGRVIIVKKRLK